MYYGAMLEMGTRRRGISWRRLEEAPDGSEDVRVVRIGCHLIPCLMLGPLLSICITCVVMTNFHCSIPTIQPKSYAKECDHGQFLGIGAWPRVVMDPNISCGANTERMGVGRGWVPSSHGMT